MELFLRILKEFLYSRLQRSKNKNQEKESANLTEIGQRLAFTKKLQGVTNKIHATRNIDEIILEVSQEICALFEAELPLFFFVFLFLFPL